MLFGGSSLGVLTAACFECYLYANRFGWFADAYGASGWSKLSFGLNGTLPLLGVVKVE